MARSSGKAPAKSGGHHEKKLMPKKAKKSDKMAKKGGKSFGKSLGKTK